MQLRSEQTKRRAVDQHTDKATASTDVISHFAVAVDCTAVIEIPFGRRSNTQKLESFLDTQ